MISFEMISRQVAIVAPKTRHLCLTDVRRNTELLMQLASLGLSHVVCRIAVEKSTWQCKHARLTGEHMWHVCTKLGLATCYFHESSIWFSDLTRQQSSWNPLQCGAIATI